MRIGSSSRIGRTYSFLLWIYAVFLMDTVMRCCSRKSRWPKEKGPTRVR